MLVKHLIRELQKCDPNKPVIAIIPVEKDGGTKEFGWKNGYYCLSQYIGENAESIYITRKYEGEDSNYRNYQDTPYPFPENTNKETKIET